jgi:hypothetical protein
LFVAGSTYKKRPLGCIDLSCCCSRGPRRYRPRVAVCMTISSSVTNTIRRLPVRQLFIDNGKKRLCIALDVRPISPRMATVIYPRPRTFALQPPSLRQIRTPQPRPQRIYPFHRSQPFSASARLYRQRRDHKDSFGTRLRKALSETKIKWHPIPVALGIAFLGLSQLYRVNEREKVKRQDEELDDQVESTGRPKRRERIRPTGPWLVF